jgi:hypothetical protein
MQPEPEKEKSGLRSAKEQADVNAEIDRIERGQVSLVPFEDLLRELEAMEREWEKQRGEGKGRA